MDCVSCDICVYHLRLFVLFPGVSLSSRVTGACPATTDLIMRVNVRTTTTWYEVVSKSQIIPVRRGWKAVISGLRNHQIR